MPQPRPTQNGAATAAWIAAALTAFASYTLGVAAFHIWTTGRQGVICGLHGQAAHCWGCYAAPVLMAAAALAWYEQRLLLRRPVET